MPQEHSSGWFPLAEIAQLFLSVRSYAAVAVAMMVSMVEHLLGSQLNLEQVTRNGSSNNVEAQIDEGD